MIRSDRCCLCVVWHCIATYFGALDRSQRAGRPAGAVDSAHHWLGTPFSTEAGLASTSSTWTLSPRIFLVQIGKIVLGLLLLCCIDNHLFLPSCSTTTAMTKTMAINFLENSWLNSFYNNWKGAAITKKTNENFYLLDKIIPIIVMQMSSPNICTCICSLTSYLSFNCVSHQLDKDALSF